MNVKQISDTSDLFKTIRSNHNLSQSELAERINTDRSYISSIELGRKPAGINIIKRLCSEFNLDLEECSEIIARKAISSKNKKIIGENSKNNTVSKKDEGNVETSNNVLPFRSNLSSEETSLDNFNTFQELFLHIRNINGFNLNEMADILKTSISYLSLIESGKKQPGKNILNRLITSFYYIPVSVVERIRSNSFGKPELTNPTEAESNIDLSVGKQDKYIPSEEHNSIKKTVSISGNDDFESNEFPDVPVEVKNNQTNSRNDTPEASESVTSLETSKAERDNQRIYPDSFKMKVSGELNLELLPDITYSVDLLELDQKTSYEILGSISGNGTKILLKIINDRLYISC